jgi:hypothetical protein
LSQRRPKIERLNIDIEQERLDPGSARGSSQASYAEKAVERLCSKIEQIGGSKGEPNTQ